MLTRAAVGRIYRAGHDGAVITWRDGSITVCLPRSAVKIDSVPLKIEGRLYRVGRRTSELSYEAPALEPAENKARSYEDLGDVELSAEEHAKARRQIGYLDK